jgi:hypothetical protein
MRVGANGRQFRGDSKSNANFYDYGAEVLTVTDGGLRTSRERRQERAMRLRPTGGPADPEQSGRRLTGRGSILLNFPDSDFLSLWWRKVSSPEIQ